MRQVAEHTFSLILALSRKIIESVEKTRRGDFSLDNLRGFDLKGKVLGVIGTGHIGQHVIRIDVKKDAKAARKLGFSYATLDALLRNSDIVTLHCQYNNAHPTMRSTARKPSIGFLIRPLKT